MIKLIITIFIIIWSSRGEANHSHLFNNPAKPMARHIVVNFSTIQLSRWWGKS